MLRPLHTLCATALTLMTLQLSVTMAADEALLNREAWACRSTADWDELDRFGVSRDREGFVLKLKQLALRGRCRHFDQGVRAVVIDKSIWSGKATLRITGSVDLWIFQRDVID